MPKDKDLKRRVRRRMLKTGESYSTARAHTLKHRHQPDPADYARLAGMSDAAVRKATGCPWERWVRALDRVKAHEWPHREIARHVAEQYEVSAWWAQSVTVGYERIRGLRAVGQRRSGTFEVSKSRTVPVPVSTLYLAFSEKRRRRRWLDDVELVIRTSRRDKSMRITWPDGTLVQVNFTAKGPARSQVTVQHAGLPDQGAAKGKKVYWGDRLTDLSRLLSAGG